MMRELNSAAKRMRPLVHHFLLLGRRSSSTSEEQGINIVWAASKQYTCLGGGANASGACR
jgi:hypothetical protein